MCLIVFAWQQHPKAGLLLAANRDEFHARPAAPAGFWPDAPQILAGRDLEAQGTWLGISRSGRFAAITNIRDPQPRAATALRSRGELTSGFLLGDEQPQDFLASVAARVADYQGFNLLLGDGQSLWYLHGSRDAPGKPTPLKPGIYGLSNAALDVPWPKVIAARDALRASLSDADAPPHEGLRQCLQDRRLAETVALAEQGLNGDMARQLSAQFIVTPAYGTRCCTTLRLHADGSRDFAEQRFDNQGEITGCDEFTLPAP
jgi:uncharacterized protein with NRDE domain